MARFLVNRRGYEEFARLLNRAQAPDRWLALLEASSKSEPEVVDPMVRLIESRATLLRGVGVLIRARPMVREWPLGWQVLVDRELRVREGDGSTRVVMRPEDLVVIWPSRSEPDRPQDETSPFEPEALSPDERELDVRVLALNGDLLRELRRRPELLYQLAPRQFEELMAELYARQGFEVEVTKRTRDGGVDLYLLNQTPTGRALVLVEAKRYRADRPVGVGVVRQLYGVVEARRASAGVVATTSFFTPPARRFQEEVEFRMGLQDFRDLQRMLAGTR